MVTADVIGLYPSITHEAGLNILREGLDNRENKHTPTDNLLKIADFEFDGKVKKQLLGTAIGTNFAPTYASVFKDKLDSDFLKFQELTPYLSYRYTDDVFFVWTHGEEKLASFLNVL